MDGEDGRVVIGADCHHRLIAGEVMDAVRTDLAQFGGEIVHLHRFGVLLRLPLSSAVFEVADNFLFPCVDRDDRLSVALVCLNICINAS